MRRAWLLFGTLTLGSCNNAAAPTANLAGLWSYSASSLQDGSVTCGLSGVTLILEQTGASFTGTYNGGVLTCGTGADSGFIGEVVNGTVAGAQVTFDFDNSNWQNSGRLTGTSMTGQAVWIVGIGSTLYHLSGTWTAIKN